MLYIFKVYYLFVDVFVSVLNSSVSTTPMKIYSNSLSSISSRWSKRSMITRALTGNILSL